MISAMGGPPEAQGAKTSMPTTSVGQLQPRTVAMPQLQRPMAPQKPSFAQGMAQSGMGAPQPQGFDPKMIQQLMQR